MAVLRKCSGTTFAAIVSVGSVIYLLYVFIPVFNSEQSNSIPAGIGNKNHHVNLGNIGGSFVDVMFTFTNVKKNELFIQKFEQCITTLLNYSSVPLNIHLITDEESRSVATTVIKRAIVKHKELIVYPELYMYDIEQVIKDIKDIINFFRKHFSYKPGTYYSNALFYLSPALHKVQKFSFLKKIIILDVDIQFKSDIKDLSKYFTKFESDMVIGMANEQQPVYRHLLSMFRSENPGTMVGDAPNSGFPGYNSGVVLLNLTKMRQSVAYNTYLNSDEVQKLVKKFKFKGHLGDQDFYTLLSFENPQLFYTLPCSWNRQLCEWWKFNGYREEFDAYHSCRGKINLYHGNCNTLINYNR